MAHQRDAELDIGEAQAERVGAAAVQTRKGADATRADRQQVDLCRARIGQRDGGAALFETKIAGDAEEAKSLDDQAALGAQHFGVAAEHRQGDRIARAGVDRQRGLARRVVDDDIVEFVRLVQLDGERTDRDREAVNADEARRADRRLHAGPAAGGVGLVAHQRDAKFNARQAQAQLVGSTRVETCKSRHVAGADGQQIDIDDAVVGQRDRRRASFNRKVAGNLEEAKSADRDAALDAQQLALGAVHRQRERIARAGDNFDRICASVVDHRVVRLGRLVQLDGQRIAADRDTFDPHQRHRADAGLQAGPLPCRVGSGAHQREAKFRVGQFQPKLIWCATVDAGKGIDTGSTDGQPIDRDGARVGKSDRRARLLDAETAHRAEESKSVDRHRAAGQQQLAFGAGHRQGAWCGAGLHDQRRRGVVDHRVGQTAGLVEIEQQRIGAQCQAVDAVEAQARGVGFQTRPASCRRGHIADQREAETQIGDAETDRIRRAVVDARKGRDPRRADTQHIGADDRRIRQRDVLARLGEGKTAIDMDKTKEVQRQRAAGFEQAAALAVHIER